MALDAEALQRHRERRQSRPAPPEAPPAEGEAAPLEPYPVGSTYPLSPKTGRAVVRAIESITPKPARDIIGKVGNVITSIEGGAAKIMLMRRRRIEKLARGEIGIIEALRPASKEVREAALEGFKEQTSHVEWAGLVPGTILDIVAPTSALIPVTPAARLAAIPVKGAAGLAKAGIAKAAVRSTKFAAAKEATEEVGSALRMNFDQRYRLRKLGIADLEPEIRVHAGRVAKIAHTKQAEAGKEISRLVKDEDELRKLHMALEEPVERVAKPQESLAKIGRRIQFLEKERAKLEARRLALLNRGVARGPEPARLTRLSAREQEMFGRDLPELGQKWTRIAHELKMREQEIFGMDLPEPKLGRGLSGPGDPRNVESNAFLEHKARIMYRRGRAFSKDVSSIERELARTSKEKERIRRNQGRAFSEEVSGIEQERARVARQITNAEVQKFRVPILGLKTQERMLTAGIERLEQRADKIIEVEEMVRTGQYMRMKEAWQQNYDSMAPDTKKAFPIAQKWNKQIELDKIEGKVLAPEVAKAAEQKFGVTHVPRYMTSRNQALEAVDRQIGALAAHGVMPDKGLLELRADIESLPKSPFTAYLRRSRGTIKKPRFLKERKMGPLSTLGHTKDIFGHDMARTLEVESLATARAIADRKQVVAAIENLKPKGLYVTKDEAAIKSGKWTEAPNFPGLPKGMMVPTPIAKEVFGSLARSIDEEGIDFAVDMFQQGTRMYRNWQLFIAPEFFARNIVSSIHNNYVRLKMGPESAPDYGAGAIFESKFRHGTFSSKEQVPLVGMNEERFLDWAFENRLLHGGQTSESAIEFASAKTRRNLMLRLISPGESNPILRGGFKFQEIIENRMRLAAFFNQVRKGFTKEQALQNVIDANFDYLLGLTKFERTWMRSLFPFYSWIRFNMPLQLEMLVKNPGRYVNVARTIRGTQEVLGGPQPNEDYLPDWLAEEAHMRVHYNKETKTWEFLRLGPSLPSAELEKLTSGDRMFREVMGQIHPAKRLFEMGANIDLWRSTPTNLQPIEEYPGETEELLGMTLPKRTWGHLLRSARAVYLADDVIETMNAEYGGKVKAGARLLFGKTVSVNEEDARKKYRKITSYQLRELKSLRKIARREGDTDNLQRLNEQINELRESRRAVLGYGDVQETEAEE